MQLYPTFFLVAVSILRVSTVVGQGKIDTKKMCPNFPWKNLRLPKTVHPTVYEIQIRPNLTDFTWSGWVKIYANVSEKTDTIVFYQSGLNFSVKKVEVKNWRKLMDYRHKISFSDVKTCNVSAQVSLKLEKSLIPGTVVILTIEFKGKIKKSFAGLYRTDFQNTDGSIISNAVTHLEPSYARKVFPCFDEPEFKANFQVSIIREPKHKAFANMPLRYTAKYSGDLLIDKFDTSEKMSTYLFAIAVGTLARISNTSNSGVKVSVVAVPEHIQFGDFALKIGIEALEFYEKMFRIPYPLPKMDLLSVPDFAAGAMENWGLITFRDKLLLLNPEESTQPTKEDIVATVCHEIAHQWFGNLVTMTWWNDLWLNEGFATYMEFYVTAKIKPEWNYFTHFYSTVTSPALYRDGFASSHAIQSEVHDPEEIESVFDAISYNKGASVVNMLINLTGEVAFRQGLQEYFKIFAYSNARGEDLWNILGKHIQNLRGEKLTDVATTWTTQVGYPLVQVVLSPDKYRVVVKQIGRFFYLKTERENDTKPRFWPVPLSFISDQNPKPQIRWLEGSETPIAINFSNPVKWIKFNVEGTGFYRVLYDKSLYKGITNQLETTPKGSFINYVMQTGLSSRQITSFL